MRSPRRPMTLLNCRFWGEGSCPGSARLMHNRLMPRIMVRCRPNAQSRQGAEDEFCTATCAGVCFGISADLSQSGNGVVSSCNKQRPGTLFIDHLIWVMAGLPDREAKAEPK